MKLVEFMAYWPGDYSAEQISTYQVLHGDDRNTWPPTNSYTPIVIDIEKIIRFNPAMKDCITVDIQGGNAITLHMKYEQFADILASFGVKIYNFKNAV